MNEVNSSQITSGSKLNRGLKLGAILLLEFIGVFIVGEAIARWYLPSGPRFIHPQILVQPNSRRIYEHIPNQYAFTIDKPFVTNTMGFRDDREVPANKNGEFRIFSLGDSVAVGLGVSVEHTYVRQLEKLLDHHQKRVRVINAAVASYSTWQEVDLLKEKGIQFQPDIVLLAFYWNDLYIKPVPIVPLPKNLSGDQQDAALKYLRLLKRSALLLFLRERTQILLLKISPTFDWTHQEMIYEGASSPYLEQAYTEVGTSLEEFGSLAREHAFVPILIILPIPGQVRHLDAPKYMQERIGEMAKKAGLHTLDVLPSLQRAYAANPDLFIPWDNTHFSPRGHQVMAETLQQYLLTHGWISQRET
jgi:lysophospholipase L1-like esterase